MFVVKSSSYSEHDAYAHLGSGISVGLAGLAAGLSIGVVGDAGVRANGQRMYMLYNIVHCMCENIVGID